MSGESFDRFSRLLGKATTRRQVVRTLAGMLATGAGAGLLLHRNPARAATCARGDREVTIEGRTLCCPPTTPPTDERFCPPLEAAPTPRPTERPTERPSASPAAVVTRTPVPSATPRPAGAVGDRAVVCPAGQTYSFYYDVCCPDNYSDLTQCCQPCGTFCIANPLAPAAQCVGGIVCPIAQACAGTCCPAGTVCRNGVCCSSCDGVTCCPAGTACGNGICCPEGQAGSNGICCPGGTTSCPTEYNIPAFCCPAGQTCGDGEEGFYCYTPPCPNAQECGAGCCPTTSYCLNGVCTATCKGAICTASEGCTEIGCCPSGDVPCNGACCAGSCINGACCPQNRSAEYFSEGGNYLACCPEGQVAGANGLGCVAAPATCPPGQTSCGGACCAIGSICGEGVQSSAPTCCPTSMVSIGPNGPVCCNSDYPCPIPNGQCQGTNIFEPNCAPLIPPTDCCPACIAVYLACNGVCAAAAAGSDDPALFEECNQACSFAYKGCQQDCSLVQQTCSNWSPSGST